jgi:diguanylate cyclase (GGDEF)-like protein
VPGGQRLGTLCLIDRQPRALGDDDLALLHDLARMAEQELAAIQLATMDDLTGLSNRRGFEALAQHALLVCKRIGAPATALFIDLDRFKAINDARGHAEGDRALADFARLLKDVHRDSDLIGRLGGDEFVVLLTATTADATLPSIERLRSAVREHEVRERRGYALDSRSARSSSPPRGTRRSRPCSPRPTR